MGSASALGFIGSYDDALSNVEANKIVGLDADGLNARIEKVLADTTD